MHKERRLGWACPKTSAGVMAVWGGELQSWFGAWCYLCCNLPLTPTPPSCKLHFPQLEEEKVRAEEPQVLEYSNGASPWDVQGDSWSESGHGPPPLCCWGLHRFLLLADPASYCRSASLCFHQDGSCVPPVECLFTDTPGHMRDTNARARLWPRWTRPRPLDGGGCG